MSDWVTVVFHLLQLHTNTVVMCLAPNNTHTHAHRIALLRELTAAFTNHTKIECNMVHTLSSDGLLLPFKSFALIIS